MPCYKPTIYRILFVPFSSPGDFDPGCNALVSGHGRGLADGASQTTEGPKTGRTNTKDRYLRFESDGQCHRRQLSVAEGAGNVKGTCSRRKQDSDC